MARTPFYIKILQRTSKTIKKGTISLYHQQKTKKKEENI